jgi:outer membrane protein assembly factor BamB
MSDRAPADPFEQLLGMADRPAAPSPEFGKELRARLIAELTADQASAEETETMSAMTARPPVALDGIQSRRTTRRLMPILEMAAAILIVFGFVAAIAGPNQVKDGFGLFAPPAQQPEGGSASMLGGNPGRTGEQPGPGPAAEPELAWTIDSGAGDVVPAQFVAHGDILYLAGDAASIGQTSMPYLRAVRISTRDVLWQSDFKVWGGVAATDNLLFAYLHNVPTGSEPSTISLAAIDAKTGALVWEQPLGGIIGGIDAVSPIVIDSTVYGVIPDGTAFAFETATGAEIWTSTGERARSGGGEGERHTSAGQFAVSDGFLFRVDLDGTLAAIDLLTGEEVWRISIQERIGLQPRNATVLSAGGAVALLVEAIDQPGADSATPVAAEGRIKTVLATFDAPSGGNLWSKQFSGFGSAYAVLDYGIVVALAEDAESGAPRQIERFDLKTGASLNVFEASLSNVLGAAVVGSTVYLTEQGGRISAWNVAADHIEWVLDTGASLAGPVSVVNGMLIVSSADGATLSVYGTPEKNEAGRDDASTPAVQPTVVPPTSTPAPGQGTTGGAPTVEPPMLSPTPTPAANS